MEIEDSNNLKIITNYISEVLKVDVILCVGAERRTVAWRSLLQGRPAYHTQCHYDLLIVSDAEVIDLVKLQNDCFSETQMTVNLLIHSSAEVARLLAEGNCFFYTIFKKADQLYLGSSFQQMLDEIPFVRQPDSMSIWRGYYDKAIFLHQSAEKILEEPKTAVDLIVETMEIICIGLLKSKLDYRPRYTGLDYLFPLCSLVSNQLCSVFSVNTSELMLLKRQSPMDLLPDGLRVITILHQQCGEFLKIADALCGMPDHLQNRR